MISRRIAQLSGRAPVADDVRLLREQLRLVHRRSPASVGGALACATVLVIALDPANAVLDQWLWWSALASLSLWRILRVRSGPWLEAALSDPLCESRRTTLATAAAGALWGIWPLVFHAGQAVDTLLLVAAVYAAMLAVSAASNAVHWPTFLAFSIPQTTPLIALLFMSDVAELRITGGLLAMFFGVNLALARRSHVQSAELVRQRFINQDLATDLAAEKARVEQTLFAKSRFLAAASHDLRQPLHAMRMLIAGLETADVERRRAIDVDLAFARDALQHLFDAVLDIAHVEADVLPVDHERVPLAPLLEALGRTLGPIAHARGLGFRVDAGQFVVRTDAVLLQRVLLNLVGNALRYTETGRIEILAHASDPDTVVIAIDDTGVGIREEAHRSLFDARTREREDDRADPSSDGAGHGLGLSIVRRLCELLQVGLAVQSAPGEGSRFELRLERVRQAHENTGGRATAGAHPPAR